MAPNIHWTTEMNPKLHPCVILSTVLKSWWHFLASFAATSVFVSTSSVPRTVSLPCFPLLSAFLIFYLLGPLPVLFSESLGYYMKRLTFYIHHHQARNSFLLVGKLINHSCFAITFISLALLTTFKMLKAHSLFLFTRYTFFSFCILHHFYCLNTRLWITKVMLYYAKPGNPFSIIPHVIVNVCIHNPSQGLSSGSKCPALTVPCPLALFNICLKGRELSSFKG